MNQVLKDSFSLAFLKKLKGPIYYGQSQWRLCRNEGMVNTATFLALKPA